MAKFHQVGIVFSLYVVALLYSTWGMGLSVPIGVWLVPHLVFFYIIAKNAIDIESDFYLSAICKGRGTEQSIALTFDDGPDPEYTPQVLDLLKKHNIKATFFLIGHKLEGNEEIVKRIDAEGHLIGNHSFTHKILFDFKLSYWVRKELQDTQAKIQAIIGKKVRYFRPPYGVTTPHISIAVKKEKYKVIGWNIRTFDGVINEKEQILQNAKQGLEGGSIVLMHDIKPVVLEVLKAYLPYLKAQAIDVVPLDKLIGEKPYFAARQ